MSLPSRASNQNLTAQLAAEFNQFYLDITSPTVSQIGNYRIVKEIGEGAFGTVYLAQHVLLKVKCVLKCGKLDDANMVREIFYHRQLKHKNVVKLYEIIKTESYLWMALEYCEGSELFYYIYEQRRLDTEVIRRLFYQIVEGIRHVHSLNLSHRDLKLENILLADKKKSVVKLTDFGFVREFNPHRRQFLSTVCGTTAYMAPEMLMNERYSGFAVDVWSMGCILYAMAYGELPFDDDDDLKAKYRIIHNDPAYPDDVDPDLHDLIVRMLCKDPAKRPTISEIFNSPFLLDSTNASLEKRISMYNDTESIVSINQHYKENTVPFQTKIERDLLKKFDKLNLDTDFLQASIYAGHTNPLTAFYELSLTREYKKKKYRYKRRRYSEAKRQIRRSRKRVRSALSLSDQMSATSQPLERIISSLSLNSNRNSTFESTTKSNVPRKSLDRRPSSVGMGHLLLGKKRLNSSSTSYSQTTTTPKQDGPASIKDPYQWLVSFTPEDPKSSLMAPLNEPNMGKGKKILNKLQFWKKNRKDDEDMHMNESDEEDEMLELKVDRQRSSNSPEKHIADSGPVEELAPVLMDNSFSKDSENDGRLENHQRNISIDTNVPSPTADTTPGQISFSQDSYTGGRRQRPESVVSQMSQLSQLSQMYPMSESELDMLDGTDMDEDDLDEDVMYELSINTSQPELIHQRLSTSGLSGGGNSRKKRPVAQRHASDSLIKSSHPNQPLKSKRTSLSLVSSDSSDDSDMRIRLIDGVRDQELQRPLLPRLRFNASKQGFSGVNNRPKAQGNTGNSVQNTGMYNPVPVNATMTIKGINRSHSPPIQKKFGTALKPMDNIPEDGNPQEPKLGPSFEPTERWRETIPKIYERTIQEEDEEDF